MSAVLTDLGLRVAAHCAHWRRRLNALLDSHNAATWVLVIGIATMVISTRIAWEAADKEARLQDDASAGHIASRIAESLSEYEALLRVTSRMAAPTAVNALEGIHGYFLSDTLGRFYGAATYLAFIRRVPQSGVAAYERAMQYQLSADESGVTSMQLQTRRGAVHYFLESSVNIAGQPPQRGLDLAEDTMLARALRGLQEPGGLALMLAQATPDKPALSTPALITAVQSPLARDSLPVGYLVLGVDLHRLVEPALRGEPASAWQVTLSTVPPGQQAQAPARATTGAEPGADIYSSHPLQNRDARRSAARQQQQPAGAVLRQTSFGDLPLVIEVRSLAARDTGLLQYLPWLVLAGSGLVTILSWLLFQRIQHGRARAESLAYALGEEAYESNQRFRDLVESSSDWIWEVDRDFRFTYASPNTYMLFGIPPQQLMGRPMDALASPAKNGRPPFPFAPGHPEAYTSYERELQGATGDGRVLESSASLIIDDKGKFAGLRGTDRDVTEQRRIQMQLSTLRDKLSENMRANLVEQLLTGLAHELNQPLSAIATYSQACIRLLDQEHADLDEVREAMKSTARHALLAGDIIKGLRRLTASRTPQLARVEVGTLLRNAISLVEFRLKAGNIVLHIDIAPDLPYVWADTVLLTQVCLNLLHNAIDALAQASPRRIEVLARRDGGGNVEIEFRDWGAGVDAANAARIFDKRFTTKAAGMGLGLTISRSIMDALNGTLTFHPAPGQGSVFTITLPFRQSA